MLDTLKVKIPLTEKQHRRLLKVVSDDEKPQWVLYDPKTGELGFLRCKGLAETDQNSYHRHLLFDAPLHWVEGRTYLTLEFSVPKYWYGHNVSLLHDWAAALTHLKGRIEKQFRLMPKHRCERLPEVTSWEVHRADLCYAYQFPSQQSCHQYLESLKHLRYPRKRPTIHPTSLFFGGAIYSLKIYEKHPEFKAHDGKELRKGKASPQFISYLEQKSLGVLRVEATLRRKYLQRNGVKTIADLQALEVAVGLSDDWMPGYFGKATLALLLHTDRVENNRDLSNSPRNLILTESELDSYFLWIDDSGRLIAILDENQSEIEPPFGEILYYECASRTATIEVQSWLESKLQYFITKFFGGDSMMQEADQVQSKLLEAYKPVKAGRLTAFWLYVRKFGVDEAKNNFGKDSFYRSRRELKEAGVTLMELPKNVVDIDKDFQTRFRMRIPSEYVVNKVDDFRDGDNLLNLPAANNG